MQLSIEHNPDGTVTITVDGNSATVSQATWADLKAGTLR
jgi:hypothetical protein